MRIQEKGNVQAQASGPNSEAPKRNHFSALCSRGEQEESLYVVTSMLQVFSINVYTLIYPASTFSFVTPLVARKFNVLPDVLIQIVSVTTTMGEFVVARRVFRSYPISLSKRLIWIDFVELHTFHFDVIYRMDWLHA